MIIRLTTMLTGSSGRDANALGSSQTLRSRRALRSRARNERAKKRKEGKGPPSPLRSCFWPHELNVRDDCNSGGPAGCRHWVRRWVALQEYLYHSRVNARTGGGLFHDGSQRHPRLGRADAATGPPVHGCYREEVVVPIGSAGSNTRRAAPPLVVVKQ